MWDLRMCWGKDKAFFLQSRWELSKCMTYPSNIYVYNMTITNIQTSIKFSWNTLIRIYWVNQWYIISYLLFRSKNFKMALLKWLWSSMMEMLVFRKLLGQLTCYEDRNPCNRIVSYMCWYNFPCNILLATENAQYW